MKTLKFPMEYSGDGVAVCYGQMLIVNEEVKHYLNTLKGERVIYDSWGVPIEILFGTESPFVFAARIDLELERVIPSDMNYEVRVLEYIDSRLTLQIIFLTDDEVQNSIRNSLIAIYATQPESTS